MTDTNPRPALDAEWISDEAARTPGRALWWGMSGTLALRLGLIVLALALVGAGWLWLRAAPDPVRVPDGLLELVDVPVLGQDSGTASVAPPGGAGEATPAVEQVFVHVAGSVATPGLFAVPAGTRVGDALTTAGGPGPDADLNAVNLAAVVADGEQIYVPSLAENAPPAQAAAGPGGAAGGQGQPVNLNTATAETLATLPGIGPVTADNIVADRTANGPFVQVSDLQRISGIGPALVAKLDGRATT